jgi:hypothetical protein
MSQRSAGACTRANAFPVQFDPPDDPGELYIHRVGQTAQGEGKNYVIMHSGIIMGLLKDNLDWIVQFDPPMIHESISIIGLAGQLEAKVEVNYV